MKTKIASMLTLAIVMMFAVNTFAQKGKEVIKEQKIKVNFQCENGKAQIERELAKTPGVKEVIASMETKEVTIKYVDGKTTKDDLVKAIEKIGYSTEFSKGAAATKPSCSKSCAGDRPKP